MKDSIRYPVVLFIVCAAAGLALSATFALTYETISQKDKQKEAKAVISALWNVETPEGTTWANFTPVKADPHVYVAYADPQKTSVLGYAAIGEAAGYSSTVKVMLGLKPEGKGQYRVLGIKVVAQQETPGLGTRVNDVYTKDTLWSAIASMFTADTREKAVETPAIKAAAQGLGVAPGAFPARPAFQQQFAGKLISVQNGKASGLALDKSQWSKVQAGEFPQDEHTVAGMTGATISSTAVIGAICNAAVKIDKALHAETATPPQAEK